jgi:hypothetical protein
MDMAVQEYLGILNNVSNPTKTIGYNPKYKKFTNTPTTFPCSVKLSMQDKINGSDETNMAITRSFLSIKL